jgi:hypothetical protein
MAEYQGVVLTLFLFGLAAVVASAALTIYLGYKPRLLLSRAILAGLFAFWAGAATDVFPGRWGQWRAWPDGLAFVGLITLFYALVVVVEWAARQLARPND